MNFLKMVFAIDYIDKPNFLLQDKLTSWIQNEEHSDVEFEVEGTVLKAHKIILIGKNIILLYLPKLSRKFISAQSEVFHAMFQNAMIEQQSGVVKVEDISLETFQELLRYIYTEQIPKLDELAGELLAAAEKYQLDDLKERCERRLVFMTTVDNAVDMLQLADLYNADVLMQETLSFIKVKELVFQKQ